MSFNARSVFVYIVAASLTAGCTNGGARGIGLLPSPATDAAKFSNYQPKNPYVQLAQGILTRTLFEASSGKGYRVEVRDLLVGPRMRSATVSLPGTAVFEVQSGGGTITIADRPQEFNHGATFSIPENAAFKIENKSDIAIAMRVHLFSAE
jgi:mannose-6-phosphate isomerase-like protein (cupin superfamily)